MNDTTPPDAEPVAPADGPRRLRRSSDKTVGGVAGGIAEYFAIDPTIVRLTFVALVFAGGSGVLAYLVAWLVIPGPPPEGSGPPAPPRTSGSDRQTIIMLVVLGIVVLVFGGGPLWWLFGWGPSLALLLPLALIAVAIALLVDRPDRPTRAAPSPTAKVGASGAGRPSTALAPYETAEAAERSEEPTAHHITLVALAGIAVFLGFAALGDLADFWELNLVAGFSIAAVVVGVALLVSAFVGRAVALVPLGILLVFGILVSTALDPIVENGLGVREHNVDRLEDLQSEYRLGAGEMVVDLRDIDFSGESRTVDVELGMGEVRIEVPRGIRVIVDGEVGAGELDIFGAGEGGLGVDVSHMRDGADGELVVRVDVGAGYGKVD